jgi:uncharacterized membrane protein YgdD (TMEM256/DUF423 family)
MNRRLVSALAALLCGLSVGLGAYAAHVAVAQDRQRIALAAVFAFGHGLALLALRAREGALATATRACFLAGIALFCGSLAAAALFAGSTRLAPAGGTLLMLGWLLASVELLRKD